MKFEDIVNSVAGTLGEDIAPVAGNPVAVNPSQIPAPQGQQGQQGQQQQQQGVNPQGNQNNELTADQVLNWMGAQDPKTVEELAKKEGDAKMQAIAAMMAQQQQGGQPNAGNPAIPGGGTQTTSASTVPSNTSGTMNAGSVQV